MTLGADLPVKSITQAHVRSFKTALIVRLRERRPPFTVEQVRAILDKLPTSGYMRWLWLIALYSGARLAEIAGLRREDV